MSRFGRWWRNKLADAIDRDILDSTTAWCRYRGVDGHCHLPHRLHVMGTARVGWAVWSIDDRGVCPRTTWPQQMSCDLPGEEGPDVGGAPSPVPWEAGGQRDRPIEPTRLPPGSPPTGPGLIVTADGRLRVLSGIEGTKVLLDDGRTADAAKVTYPGWHATRGLSLDG